MAAIDRGDMLGVDTAIIAPTCPPRGAIGAVVWASPDAQVDVAEIFATRACEFHLLVLRLTGAYQEAVLGACEDMARLTRREIQLGSGPAQLLSRDESGSGTAVSSGPVIIRSGRRDAIISKIVVAA